MTIGISHIPCCHSDSVAMATRVTPLPFCFEPMEVFSEFRLFEVSGKDT